MGPALDEAVGDLGWATTVAEQWPDLHLEAWAFEVEGVLEVAYRCLVHAGVVVSIAEGLARLREGEVAGPVGAGVLVAADYASEGEDARAVVADRLGEALRFLVGPVVQLVELGDAPDVEVVELGRLRAALLVSLQDVVSGLVYARAAQQRRAPVAVRW